MRSKLINVRLSPEDASKAEALKRDGIELSGLVREAIRAEYSRRFKRLPTGAELAAGLDKLYARFPIPKDVQRPNVDPSDRLAFQQFIRERIKREIDGSRPSGKRRRAS